MASLTVTSLSFSSTEAMDSLAVTTAQSNSQSNSNESIVQQHSDNSQSSSNKSIVQQHRAIASLTVTSLSFSNTEAIDNLAITSLLSSSTEAIASLTVTSLSSSSTEAIDSLASFAPIITTITPPALSYVPVTCTGLMAVLCGFTATQMDRLDVLFARREKVQPTKNTQNNSSDIKLVQEICPTPGDKLEGEGETDLSSTPQGVPNIHCRSLLSVLLNNNHIGRLQNGVFTGLKELRYLSQFSNNGMKAIDPVWRTTMCSLAGL
uniref:Uncharacterized protein n=1 Tax=Timema bartmani TaxID=61472 RepID=A0A7R9I427_9NEOP|nr:unnamed protein product [Timema bartmani]